MPLTAYCLGYGTGTVIPRQWHDDFSEMRDCGFDNVALSFSEGEMRYARRAFEMQVACAHEHGLKVHAIPSRLGGRVAGWPLMVSLWLAEHPASQLPENPTLACIEDPAFRDWTREFIVTLFTDYELDGLIWDEPKSSAMVTKHPATLAKLGPSPTPEAMADSFAGFIGELTAAARAVRPNLEVTLFNMPTVNVHFTSRCAFIDGIDYLGFDGCFSRESYFREEPAKIKHFLSERWERTQAECAAGGKKTFALIENMLMPRGVVEEFRQGLTAYLQQAHPDHLACYYYAHNNEEPEAVHKAVVETIRKYYLGV